MAKGLSNTISAISFYKKNSRGFTLVELLVVLAIMVALTIIVVSGYSEGRPRLATERTTESFIMNLYRARDRGFFFSNHSDGDVDGRYGISVDKNSEEYVFFFEEDGVFSIIEEISIERMVGIFEIETPQGIVNNLNVLFSSDKNVYFNENLLSGDDYIDITFSGKSDDTIKRTVRINAFGVAKIIY